jgi:hypothetical protein
MQCLPGPGLLARAAFPVRCTDRIGIVMQCLPVWLAGRAISPVWYRVHSIHSTQSHRENRHRHAMPTNAVSLLRQAAQAPSCSAFQSHQCTEITEAHKLSSPPRPDSFQHSTDHAPSHGYNDEQDRFSGF